MSRIFGLLMVLSILSLPSSFLSADESSQDKVQYVKEVREAVLEEMEAKNEQADEERRAETQRIRDEQEKRKKSKEEKEIRFDFSGVKKPASPDVFQSVFHFAPVRQYLTGTCWCFSTTSYFESEVYRLSGKKIKLSEMYTVYFEYLEKARRYVQERGDSVFDQGSEGNAVIRIWNKYGAVPAEAYHGELDEDGRFDHSQMIKEMKAYLEFINQNNIWDEELTLSSIRLILDKYMGRPPEQFSYNGAQWTPQRFLAEELQLQLDDYVFVMSTLSQPFFEFGEYEFKDNWWHSKDFYNAPLDDFYTIVKKAIQSGYSARINGDVSEPGLYGMEDVAIVPTFDIPREFINQDSREFRIFNQTTQDDHDVHLVGYTQIDDDEWFLIKDSASSPQMGKHKGYYFYRSDYIRLKMLTLTVHKDVIRTVWPDFNADSADR
ncbi:MAG: peptidase C1 [Candidatus Omnitrophica bacterium]|nr:peptidase C1 [Candidatus Omnitrophota bacterium]